MRTRLRSRTMRHTASRCSCSSGKSHDSTNAVHGYDTIAHKKSSVRIKWYWEVLVVLLHRAKYMLITTYWRSPPQIPSSATRSLRLRSSKLCIDSYIYDEIYLWSSSWSAHGAGIYFYQSHVHPSASESIEISYYLRWCWVDHKSHLRDKVQILRTSRSVFCGITHSLL